MGFSHQLILFVILIPLISCANPIHRTCEQNFTNNNILQANINKVLFDMTTKTVLDGNSFSKISDGENSVYGLTQCRADVGRADCSGCILAAVMNLQVNCPNTSSSRIWYEFCFIRYDTSNFLGSIDVTGARIWGSRKGVANPKGFDIALWELLNWVKRSAASESNKFGMGKRNLDENITIYGMAQCTQDLSGISCLACLENLTINFKTSCFGHAGCHELSTSCVLRFEIYNFFKTSNIPSFQGDAALAPTPTPT